MKSVLDSTFTQDLFDVSVKVTLVKVPLWAKYVII